MREEIKAQLRRIEEEQNIKMLLAVESGSRAWGFTPYLHLWKIGLVIKTYGNYKGYVLKIRKFIYLSRLMRHSCSENRNRILTATVSVLYCVSVLSFT